MIDDVASGRVELEKIEEKYLAAELKALNYSQRKAPATDSIKERQALQAEIDNLAKQRQAFIEKKVRKEVGSVDILRIIM